MTEKTARAFEHCRMAWAHGITIGVNPAALLLEAHELAGERTPEADLAAAAFAAEGLRHLLTRLRELDVVTPDRIATVANLSEELQQVAAKVQ